MHLSALSHSRILQGFPSHIPWQPSNSCMNREAGDEHMFVKPAWCKHQTVTGREDASVASGATLERVLLSRLTRSFRNNALHAMIGHWQAESLDGWQRSGPACDKPPTRRWCTRVVLEQPVECRNSTARPARIQPRKSQSVLGSNVIKTRMTCGVRNCRAVLNAGGAHTVLTNNSLNQTRPRFLLHGSQMQVALIYSEARIRARRLAQKGCVDERTPS